jgi:hypothetical protein
MPRLSKEAWDALRLDYEAGMSLRNLGERYGVDKKAIQQKASNHGWRRDPQSEIEVRVVKKVVENEAKKARAKKVPGDIPTQPDGTGDIPKSPQTAEPLLPRPVDAPLTKEEAAEAEAERRASVVTRHRDEWDAFEAVKQRAEETFFDPPMITRTVQTGDKTYTYDVPDFSQIDAAKRLAEVILIRQKGERAAFQLDKNVNTDKVVEASERDRIIRDTFAVLRDAARKAAEKQRELDEREREMQRMVDITPKGNA